MSSNLIARSIYFQVVDIVKNRCVSMVYAPKTCYSDLMEQDLFKTLPHLQLRHKKFGIRVPVPTEIQEVVGKKEITRSLKTGDPEQVPSAYRKKMAKIDDIFEEARRSLNPPKPTSISVETATELAFNYFQNLIGEEEEDARQLVNDLEITEKARNKKLRSCFLISIQI